MSKELYVDDVNVEGLLTGWFDNGSGMESGVIMYVRDVEVVFTISELLMMVEECEKFEG